MRTIVCLENYNPYDDNGDNDDVIFVNNDNINVDVDEDKAMSISFLVTLIIMLISI
jgi:hypothetical protein